LLASFYRVLCGALLSFALGLSLSACGGAGNLKSKDFDAEESAAVRRGVKPEPDAEAAVIETDYGLIVVELYPNLAPKMVERFKTLVREGFYDGTTFHRINPRTGVIQGGDPNSKDADPSNDGAGDSPYPDVPAEFSDVPFERGTLGAARQGAHPAFGNQPALSEEEAYDTANCQFYITLRRVPEWDEQYTVFGRVIRGMDTVSVIGDAPVRPGSERPDPSIPIRRISLQPRTTFK
jgi:cyclophilin family peptidyl-prolyl cis-trans isomerase